MSIFLLSDQEIREHISKNLGIRDDEKDKYAVIYEKAYDIACPRNLKGDAFMKCDSDFYDKFLQ